MIELPNPLQAILQAHADGWSQARVLPDPLGHAPDALLWHANGVSCAVRTGRSVWDLTFTLDARVVFLELPKIGQEPLGDDLGLLLQAMSTWIEGLDLAPRRRITHDVASWLAWNGETRPTRITLTDTPHRGLIVFHPVCSNGGLSPMTAPPALVEFLSDDLNALWRLDPTPETARGSMTRKQHAPGTIVQRRWTLTMPPTHHARMELLASIKPGLIDIPMQATRHAA